MPFRLLTTVHAELVADTDAVSVDVSPTLIVIYDRL